MGRIFSRPMASFKAIIDKMVSLGASTPPSATANQIATDVEALYNAAYQAGFEAGKKEPKAFTLGVDVWTNWNGTSTSGAYINGVWKVGAQVNSGGPNKAVASVTVTI